MSMGAKMPGDLNFRLGIHENSRKPFPAASRLHWCLIMATHSLPYISPEEYLELDRAAERRSEYVDGLMIAMAGASPAHIFIVNNISFELTGQTRGRCRVGVNDARLHIPDRKSYFYPDVIVSCAEFEIIGDLDDIFVNPRVLVEVTSKGSAGYDRNLKFAHYRSVASLADYLTVDQFRPFVEHHSRQPDGGWTSTEYASLDTVIAIPSISAVLKMSEVYRDIKFAA